MAEYGEILQFDLGGYSECQDRSRSSCSYRSMYGNTYTSLDVRGYLLRVLIFLIICWIIGTVGLLIEGNW